MMLDLCLPESWGNEEGALPLADSAIVAPVMCPGASSILGTTLVKTNGIFYGVPGPVKTNVSMRRQNDRLMH